MMPRHVLLVGLPGVGKSTVGQLVAEALKAPLLDIDQHPGPADGHAGRPDLRHGGRAAVPADGAGRGRDRPGARARRSSSRAAAGPPSRARSRRPSALASSSISSARAATAAQRSEQGEVRPLLAGADPVERMRALLEEREPFYNLADHEVAADAKDAGRRVAAEVVGAGAGQHGGW